MAVPPGRGDGHRRRVGVRQGRVAVACAIAVALAACVAGQEGSPPAGVEVAAGWEVVVVRDDLRQPTQLSLVGDGPTVWVAELAGDEGGGTGRVLDLGADGAADEPVVLLDGLLTPTGLAAVSETGLWLQERSTFSAVSLEGETPFTPVRPPAGSSRSVAAAGLPDNGRSQGTATLTPDARVLFVSTGSGTGPDVGSSGRLYAYRPASGDAGAAGGEVPGALPVAVGFKNAYAHAFGPDGELWVTEIGDGRYDGERSPGELNLVTADAYERAVGDGEPYDGGWPRCTGDGEPTEEFGATADECAALPPPVTTFPPGSTPTSVAVAVDGTVLVALWVTGRVVEVDPDTGTVTDVVTGLDQPQHLLAMPDGSVLLSVHGAGELWRLTPPGAAG